jgi:hypothetical protein
MHIKFSILFLIVQFSDIRYIGKVQPPLLSTCRTLHLAKLKLCSLSSNFPPQPLATPTLLSVLQIYYVPM